jgi:organic radical activating enzyme
MKYHLYEHFFSFQGEGVHAGRAAYFLRLHGCDQRCHFCDSAGTWHPNWRPPHVLRLTPEETTDLVRLPEGELKQGALPKGAFVVITGGEPTLQNLEPLVDLLHARDLKVHLETAGHRFIRGPFDWITLSPKLFASPPLWSSWTYADEIKLIIESPEQLKRDLNIVLDAPLKFNAPIWLHPEWSRREDAGVLRAIVETVKANPRCRAGWQLHKNFNADYFDENADKKIIPLGGIGPNPALRPTHQAT